jgi:hypothetical protein
MSEGPGQNYANHRSNDRRLIGASIGLAVSLVLALFGAFGYPELVPFAVALVALCTMVLALRIRTYAVTVQDRIIRLEMQLRLQDVLGDDLRPRIPELTLRQLIGLRYASDAELPALMQKVLDERIEKADDIKKLVKDWQADFLRV